MRAFNSKELSARKWNVETRDKVRMHRKMEMEKSDCASYSDQKKGKYVSVNDGSKTESFNIVRVFPGNPQWGSMISVTLWKKSMAIVRMSIVRLQQKCCAIVIRDANLVVHCRQSRRSLIVYSNKRCSKKLENGKFHMMLLCFRLLDMCN